MGVWHFLPLGESPGAVTSALAYLKQRYMQNDVAFFGIDSSRIKSKKVSGIVIFTTEGVRTKTLKAKNKSYVKNNYGSEKGEELPLGDKNGNLITFDVVLKFISDEFGEMLKEERGKVYWLEASHYDLDFNLEKLFQAFYALSPPNRTGDEVWINLTGGTNVMNLASLLVATMSGISGRSYYNYTNNIRLLQPANESTFWHDIPMLKLNFDQNYETILRALPDSDEWMDECKLINILRGANFPDVDDDKKFKRNYLNKLDGWLIERDGNRNRISPAGKRFLQRMDDELVRALVYKRPLENSPKKTDVFEELRL